MHWPARGWKSETDGGEAIKWGTRNEAGCDLRGTDFTAYARMVVREVLSVGRCATLVAPKDGRPTLTLFPAEDIMDWEVDSTSTPPRLSRVLIGTEVPDGHLRAVTLLLRDRRCEQLVDLGPATGLLPDNHPHPLAYIPVIFHGATNNNPGPCDLPLADIIAANVDHFRLDADYKHALHLAALPTAWVTGFDKSQALRVGSATAWVSEIPGASAGFLEFSGAGIAHLERALERSERRMALLSDELITAQSTTGEPLSPAAGGGSGLAGLVASVSASLTAVLRMAAAQLHCPAEPAPSIALNTDLDASPLRGEDITALVGAWKAGAISRDTLLQRLSRGDVLPSGRGVTEEKELIYGRRP